MNNQSVLNEIMDQYPDYEFLIADGYDHCIIGYDYGDGSNIRLIYSVRKILDTIYMEGIEDGLTEIDAIEHFEYNIRGSYMGEKTPIWCKDDF